MTELNKYVITPLRKRLSSLAVSPAQVENWMKDWRFFFAVGFGRSGTAFMANLLDQAPGAHVFHEPVLEDIPAHLSAHYDSAAAARYIQGFRKREIYVRMRGAAPSVYGEVNGHLRCHTDALKDAFPGVTVIHLVRDGRDVVRSTIPRRMMSLRNPFSLRIHPLDSDPWHARWPEMDRFARICWYWQEENRRLRTTIGRPVQFEKILSSYEYFHMEVLEPCGLQIEERAWREAINSPRNITPRHQMPKWDDWNSQQQQTFREICGAEMAACGYDF